MTGTTPLNRLNGSKTDFVTRCHAFGGVLGVLGGWGEMAVE